MNNNKVQNPKVEVPKTKEMNDCDYLTSQLSCEKNMSIDMCYALNEASCKALYDSLFPLFEQIKDMQRRLYELSFVKGWYSLEKAEVSKIVEKYNSLSAKLEELS